MPAGITQEGQTTAGRRREPAVAPGDDAGGRRAERDRAVGHVRDDVREPRLVLALPHPDQLVDTEHLLGAIAHRIRARIGDETVGDGLRAGGQAPVILAEVVIRALEDPPGQRAVDHVERESAEEEPLAVVLADGEPAARACPRRDLVGAVVHGAGRGRRQGERGDEEERSAQPSPAPQHCRSSTVRSDVPGGPFVARPTHRYPVQRVLIPTGEADSPESHHADASVSARLVSTRARWRL